MTSTLDILDRLIGYDTVSARSNLGLIDYVQDYLSSRGFTLERVTDPTGEKAGLFASIGPAGSGIMLSAHTDVVPVDGQDWTRPPFALTREGDRLFGRGTTDMKGFLAAMLNAADHAAKAPLKEPLKLAISYDEEVGCLGIAHMIDRLAPGIGLPRACIVGEPTGMQVAIGHKGKQSLRVKCRGQSGHSALAPRFVNALHLGADVVIAMRTLQDWLASQGARDTAYDVPYSTVHVGRMTAGTALNIVPDQAELLMEFRHLAEDDPADLRARIEADLVRIAAAYGGAARIDVEEIAAYPGLSTDPRAAFVAELQAITGIDETAKVAFGTEAGFFDGLGIDTVVCGPGSMEGQGHKPDEYITLDQLQACDSMLARVVEGLCR